MKKIVLIITAAFFTIACNKVSENEFLISGTANGIENGKKIFIEIQGETGSIIKDTGVIENGKFELKGQYQVMEDDNGFSAGADYKLGKNTKLFAWYSSLDFDAALDHDYLAVGLEHKF